MRRMADHSRTCRQRIERPQRIAVPRAARRVTPAQRCSARSRNSPGSSPTSITRPISLSSYGVGVRWQEPSFLKETDNDQCGDVARLRRHRRSISSRRDGFEVLSGVRSPSSSRQPYDRSERLDHADERHAARRSRKGVPLATAIRGAVGHLVHGLAIDLAPVRPVQYFPWTAVAGWYEQPPARLARCAGRKKEQKSCGVCPAPARHRAARAPRPVQARRSRMSPLRAARDYPVVQAPYPPAAVARIGFKPHRPADPPATAVVARHRPGPTDALVAASVFLPFSPPWRGRARLAQNGNSACGAS
jgi:hypothetical protein